MEFQDQSANDLVLNLIPFDRDISDLMVLVDKIISDEKYTVKYGIIGASHFVKVTNKQTNTTMIEVFACVSLDDKNVDAISVNDATNQQLKVNGFNHVFSKLTITSDDPEFLFRFNDEMNKSNVDGLQYIFPKRDDDEFDPLTTIAVTLNNGGVFISTMHAYPNEKVITITNSNIR